MQSLFTQYENHLKSLIQTKLNLKSIETIKFIDPNDFYLPSRDLFISQNIPGDQIFFNVIGENYPKKIKPTTKNEGIVAVNGVTICTKTNNATKRFIFLPETLHIDCDRKDTLIKLHQLITLIHELGHIKDMENEINFNFSTEPKTVNLVKAEAFANKFALEYFHNNNLIHARETLAKQLYLRGKSNNIFEKAHYKELASTIGAGRIKRWVGNIK